MRRDVRAATVKTAAKVALTSLLVACAALPPGAAHAAGAGTTTATGDATTAISTSTFIAYATTSPTGSAAGGAGLVLAQTTAAQYFFVRNTGTTAISAVSLAVTYSSTPAKTDFSRCDPGVAFTSIGTCASGTRTAVTAAAALTLSMQPGSWYAFELDPKRMTTPTVGVSVSSTQIRSALTSNS